METTFTILLVIHIISGSIGLLTGTTNLIRKKGDKSHKKIGLFFLYGMLINGVSGLLMSLIHFNFFLFIVGVFSIYMVGTGQRYLSLKTKLPIQKAFKIVLNFDKTYFNCSLSYIGYTDIIFIYHDNDATQKYNGAYKSHILYPLELYFNDIGLSCSNVMSPFSKKNIL